MSAKEDNRFQTALERFTGRIADSITRVKEGIKTTPQAQSFFFSTSKRFTFDKEKPDTPSFSFKNPKHENIGIRKIDAVVSDTVADATFSPYCIIKVNDVTIYRNDDETKSPFKDADLSLEFKEGKILEGDKNIDFFFWYSGSETGDKEVTVAIDLGEA